MCIRDRPRSRKRKTQKAEIVTSSPYKNQLQQAEAKKSRPGNPKNAKLTSSRSSKVAGTQQGPRPSRKQRNPVAAMSVDTTPCIICTVRYCDPPFEGWRQCPECCGWFHNSCGPEDTGICYRCLDWTLKLLYCTVHQTVFITTCLCYSAFYVDLEQYSVLSRAGKWLWKNLGFLRFFEPKVPV